MRRAKRKHVPKKKTRKIFSVKDIYIPDNDCVKTKNFSYRYVKKNS